MLIVDLKAEKFRTIYREVYGEDISLDEARMLGARLADLLFQAYCPLEDDGNEINKS